MKNKFIFPLFWKFTIAILLMVTVFGTINLYLINDAVYRFFNAELTRHGKITAANIAIRSTNPLAYNDLASLNQIVNEQVQMDSNITYVLIINQNNKVIALTFETQVPHELINANLLKKKTDFNIKRIKKKGHDNYLIWDIAAPILDGELGFVRIGLLEENFYKSMNQTKRVFLIMVLVFLFIGIIGAFIFSYIITTPIKLLKEKASIDTGKVPESSPQTLFSRRLYKTSL